MSIYYTREQCSANAQTMHLYKFDRPPMQIVQALTRLYHNILTTHSSQIINKNEKLLLAMQSHPQFLRDNIAIVTSNSTNYNLRRLAALEMGRYAKRLIEERNDGQMRVLIERLLEEVSLQELQFQLKQLLMVALTKLFSSKQSFNIKLELILSVDNLVNSMSQNSQNVNFTSLGYCAQLMLSFKEHINQVNHFIKKYFINYVRFAHQIHATIAKTQPGQQNRLIMLYKIGGIYGKVIATMMKRIQLYEEKTNQLLFDPKLTEIVTFAFKINHPSNSLDTAMFMIHPNEKLALAFNQYKIAYFQLLQLYLRLAYGFVTDKSQLQSIPLIINSFEILQEIIMSLCRMFDSESLFSWSAKSKLVDATLQLMRILNGALRINTLYYSLFNHHKNIINQKIILRCLMLSPEEIQLFDDSPQEFAERVLQVTNRDVNLITTREENKEEMIDEDDQRDCVDFDMLKCVSANCLVTLCTMQDGAVTHLFSYCLDALQGKVQTVYPFYILYQAMAIMKNALKQRSDLKQKVIEYILSQIDLSSIQGNISELQKINFCYFIILLSKIVQIEQFLEEVSDRLLKIGRHVLTTGCQAWQYVAFELLKVLDDRGMGQTNCCEILVLYNSILQRKKPTYKFIETYQLMISGNNLMLRNKKELIQVGMRLIGDYINREVVSESIDKHFILLCFNLIREVGEFFQKIPEMIYVLESTLLPIARYCRKKSWFDFQDDLFSLITLFIKTNKSISACQFQMISIIPQLYYGQYCEVFGQTFQTLQVFIYYAGSDILQFQQLLNTIVRLAHNSIQHPKSNRYSQVDACAGVLLIHNILITLWQMLPAELLKSTYAKIVKRLQFGIANDFLASNLLAALALALPQSLSLLNEQQIAKGIELLVQCGGFQDVDYAPKIMAVGMAQLLLLTNNLIIKSNFGRIFTKILNITSYELNKRNSDNSNDQSYDQYAALLERVMNKAKEVDQFLFFKSKLEVVRSQAPQLLQGVIGRLSLVEREFLGQVLRLQRVQKTARVIYKLKK